MKYDIDFNLRQDFKENISEIRDRIKTLKRCRLWTECGMLHYNDVQMTLNGICKILHKRIEIIFQDYDNLLTDNSIELILAHVDKIDNIVEEELDLRKIDIAEQCEDDDISSECLEQFTHKLFLQKLRIKNAYRRRQKRKRQEQFSIWVPISISITSLLLSVASFIYK